MIFSASCACSVKVKPQALDKTCKKHVLTPSGPRNLDQLSLVHTQSYWSRSGVGNSRWMIVVCRQQMCSHRNAIAKSSVKRWPWPFLLQHFKYCIGNRSPTNRESWTSFNFPDQSPSLYDCRRCPNDFPRISSHRKSGITRRLPGTVADCLKPGSHRVFRQSATVPDSRRVIPDFLWEHSRRKSLRQRRQS